MKIADLASMLRRCLGPSAPDRSLLRVWTDELVLVPQGGGSSGAHRFYTDGEAVWALLASTIHLFGLRGSHLKAAMIALRTWNDSKEPQPISDSGLDDFRIGHSAVWDQLAIVRTPHDAERPTYRIVETIAELSDPQMPHIRLSLAWIAQLLTPTEDGSSDAELDGV